LGNSTLSDLKALAQLLHTELPTKLQENKLLTQFISW